jgi:hypothetical protein
VYPLTFHPAARQIAEAVTVEAAAGDEKFPVDIHLQPVPGFRLSGRLDGPSENVSGMSLRLVAAGTDLMGRGIEQATALVGREGGFTFLNVPAGSYTLVASRLASQYSFQGPTGMAAPLGGRGTTSSVAAYAAPPGTMIVRSYASGSAKYQGRTTVTVGGQDVTDVVVPMQGSVSISGRIVIESSNPTVAAAVASVTAEPPDGNLDAGLPRSFRDPDDDPTYFYIESVVPGPYLLRPAGGGTLKSVTWSDRDTPIRRSRSQATRTSRASSLR